MIKAGACDAAGLLAAARLSAGAAGGGDGDEARGRALGAHELAGLLVDTGVDVEEREGESVDLLLHVVDVLLLLRRRRGGDAADARATSAAAAGTRAISPAALSEQAAGTGRRRLA